MYKFIVWTKTGVIQCGRAVTLVMPSRPDYSIGIYQRRSYSTITLSATKYLGICP